MAFGRGARGGDVHVQRRALGVLEGDHVAPLQLGLDGVHGDHRVGAHHRHIAVLAVALGGQAGQGLLACLGLGELALAGLAGQVAHQAERHVGDVGQRGTPGFELQLTRLPGMEHAEGQQAEPGQHQRQPEFLTQGQSRHGDRLQTVGWGGEQMAPASAPGAAGGGATRQTSAVKVWARGAAPAVAAEVAEVGPAVGAP